MLTLLPEDTANFLSKRKNARRMEVANHPERPEIISDRPIPIEHRGGERSFAHYYPFEDMKVGDSFWVPGTTHCTGGAILRFAKRTGWRFTSRSQSEDGRKNSEVGKKWRGLRVWRIK